MEELRNLLKLKNEKDEAYYASTIKECLDIINKEREGTKWGKMTWIALYNKVKHLDMPQLEALYQRSLKEMRRGNKFSFVFFGILKRK